MTPITHVLETATVAHVDKTQGQNATRTNGYIPTIMGMEGRKGRDCGSPEASKRWGLIWRVGGGRVRALESQWVWPENYPHRFPTTECLIPLPRAQREYHFSPEHRQLGDTGHMEFNGSGAHPGCAKRKPK